MNKVMNIYTRPGQMFFGQGLVDARPNPLFRVTPIKIRSIFLHSTSSFQAGDAFDGAQLSSDDSMEPTL